MKVRELIRDLAALAGAGMSEADVEVAILTQRGQVAHRLVINVDRGPGLEPSVVLRAVPHAAEFEVEG